MSNRNTCPSKLKQLKKAIQTETQRATGRRVPLLANNVNFKDPITYENLAPNNAWYIVPNTKNTNKIYQLYDRRTLNRILNTTKKSPFSSKPITEHNIRKYMNFKNSVELLQPTLRNTPPPAPVRTNRPRNRAPIRAAGAVRRLLDYNQNQNSLSLQLNRIRDYLVTRSGIDGVIRMFTTDISSNTTRQMIISKERARFGRGTTYIFRGTGIRNLAPASRFIETLMQTVREQFPGSSLTSLRVRFAILG